MTLIIGLLCGEGIVIGGDSMLTYGNPVVNVQQKNVKVRVVDNNVVVGVAGAQGLSQITLDALASSWQAEVVGNVKNDAKAFISDTIAQNIFPYYQRAMNVNSGQLNDNNISELLIAAPIEDQPVLMHCTYNFQIVEADIHVPYILLGSGTSMATPFLKFLLKTFWNNVAPNSVADGVFTVLWTLKHVIETNGTLGVGGDTRLAALRKNQNEWYAEILDDQLDEHKQNIAAAEDSLKNYKHQVS